MCFATGAGDEGGKIPGKDPLNPHNPVCLTDPKRKKVLPGVSGTQLSSGHRKGEPTLCMERIGDSPLPGRTGTSWPDDSCRCSMECPSVDT